jgi:hypothetical protein
MHRIKKLMHKIDTFPQELWIWLKLEPASGSVILVYVLQLVVESCDILLYA